MPREKTAHSFAVAETAGGIPSNPLGTADVRDVVRGRIRLDGQRAFLSFPLSDRTAGGAGAGGGFHCAFGICATPILPVCVPYRNAAEIR